MVGHLCWLRLVAAASLGFAPAPLRDRDAEALRKLEGEWVLVKGDDRSWEGVRIAGNRLTLLHEGKPTEFTRVLSFSRKESPFALDLSWEESGNKFVDRCLYRLEGDTLVLYHGKRLAWTEIRTVRRGAIAEKVTVMRWDTARPKSFKPEGVSGYGTPSVRVETYRRMKPAPRGGPHGR